MYKSDASAPEILLETEAYSEASDVWSAGYIILEVNQNFNSSRLSPHKKCAVQPAPQKQASTQNSSPDCNLRHLAYFPPPKKNSDPCYRILLTQQMLLGQSPWSNDSNQELSV